MAAGPELGWEPTLADETLGSAAAAARKLPASSEVFTRELRKTKRGHAVDELWKIFHQDKGQE